MRQHSGFTSWTRLGTSLLVLAVLAMAGLWTPPSRVDAPAAAIEDAGGVARLGPAADRRARHGLAVPFFSFGARS